MAPNLPEEAAALFQEFKEMQTRHLALLNGQERGSVRTCDEERQALLQRLKNWFTSKAPASTDPEFVKEELQSILAREEILKRRAWTSYREMQSEVESIRVGKKALKGYSEKGYGLGDSPHFVSRAT